ncbi:unnamed protein product, partial [Effrenium voratum]
VPTYHPGGDVAATRPATFLQDLDLSEESFAVVGFSFGGLLAATLQEMRPDKITKCVLIAPAIDNFERNFAAKRKEDWHLAEEYVAELQKLPARPSIKVPTMLIHGLSETDADGSAVWRVREWVDKEPFGPTYFPEGGHSLDIVGRGCPGWQELAHWLCGREADTRA